MNAYNSSTAGQSANPNTRRRYGLWIILAIILVVLASLLFPGVTYWDGRFELILRPVSRPGVQVQSLSYVSVNKREVAESIAGNHKTEAEAAFRSAEKQDDEFVASIRCSGQERGGIETNYHEPRFLVVRVKCENDIEVRKMVEIPIGRGKRSVDVQLP